MKNNNLGGNGKILFVAIVGLIILIILVVLFLKATQHSAADKIEKPVEIEDNSDSGDAGEGNGDNDSNKDSGSESEKKVKGKKANEPQSNAGDDKKDKTLEKQTSGDSGQSKISKASERTKSLVEELKKAKVLTFPSPDDEQIWKVAVHRIKRLLKKREQSLFSKLGTNETSITKHIDGHIVKGYYLSPNVNGEMTKSYFRCMVIKDSEGRLVSKKPEIDRICL